MIKNKREKLLTESINHIALSVNDLERSFNFYKDILGFLPLCRWAKRAYFLVGDLWFCMTHEVRHKPKKAYYSHCGFSVSPKKFKKLKERILKEGIREFKENSSLGGSFYFLDPDNHKLEIHSGRWRERADSKKENPGSRKDIE